MQYLEPHSHLSPQQRLPPMGQAIRGGPDQAAMLMSRYRVPNFPTHRDVYPTCPPGFTPGVVMRPALPPMEKDQLYPPGLRSLSPGDAEALYSCMDPKLWADSMLNPMMLPPMVDAYYNGLDFHAPGYRKNVTKETTGPLKAWLQDHRKNPYPTKAEKIMLAIITKMTLTQVSTWFANARRRLKKETGSRLDSEDGDCKILSDDEDESEATGSKQESDNEDYEISVDDDEDDNTSTDSGRVSSSTETQALLSPASRGVSRDYFRSMSRRHDKSVACERTIASLGNSKVVSSGAMYFTDGAHRQEQSKLLCETEAKPVDLSQNGSTHDTHSPQKPPEQQQQRLAIGHASTQPSHQHLSQRIAHGPQAPKNKIWSISNILSKDSADQNT